MTSMKSNENIQDKNVHLAANELTQIVFTLRDGSLHVTSKNNEAMEGVFNSFQNPPSEHLKSKLGEGEVYIEIIRNNANKLEEHPIINISSAYEAFWKVDFQTCMERRTCIKCGQVFLTPQQLLHHLQNLHKILNPQECFVCHKYFTNGLERTSHLLDSHHLHKPDFTCEACLKVFNNEYDKNAHRLSHPEKNKCKWCSAPFPCEYLLNCHLQLCALRRNDQDCHICGCYFRSSHILQLHNLRHSRVSCEICQLSFLSLSGASLEDPEVLFIQHLKSMHSPEEINNILIRLKKRDEEEETLDGLFMNQIEENLIQLSHSVLQNQQEKKQTDNSVDILHNEQQESQKIKIKSFISTFQCSECFKKFESMEELMKHELVHQTPFSCSVCCLKFPHRRGFKKHMHTHGIKVKPDSVRYKCQQCSVNCGTMSALRIHLLTHTNQKPYLCDKCGLKFRRPHALKAHEHAVHNSRILHHCSQCDTSSLSKSSLLRHVQCVHGGVRRFICGICGNRCLQNQGLRRHLKNVHKLEFPPMESLCKKSSTEIHVIPPPENLSPTDPLVECLHVAIREEKLKLDLLRKQQRTKEYVIDDSHQPTESNVDGQSLNILGDVASKATPLQQINCPTPFLQSSIGTKLQEGMRFICAGCQHTSDSLNDLSIHLTQCQADKSLLFIDEDSSVVPGSSAKPPTVYSVASPFSSSASTITSGVPYQLCVVPSLNGQIISGSMSINENNMGHPVLPSLNVGPICSQTTSITDSNLTSEPSNKVNVCNSMGLTENMSSSGGLLADLSESSGMPSNVMSSNTLEASNSYQLEFLDSSTFSFQEDYFIREQTSKAVCDLNPSETAFIPETNLLPYSGCELFEHSKQIGGYSFVHDSQQNILSENNYLRINQVPTKLVENAVSTFLVDQPKILDVSHPLTNAPVNERMVQAEPSLVPDGVISTPNHEGAGQMQARGKLLQNNSKNTGSAHDLAKSSPDPPIITTSSSSKHTVTLKSCVSASEPLNSSNASLEKKFIQVCPECGKQLSSASNFKRHLEVHFGDKTHECTYCGKCFRYKFNLTVHLRSHTGVRPFDCPACGKKFRYQSELKEHKQSHNGSKVFHCLDCGQYFARQRDLRRHSLSHKNSGKPTCHLCKKVFSRSDYLKRHIKSHKSLDHMDSESLKGLNQSPSEKIITDKSSKTSSCLEKTNVCKTQPIGFAGANEKNLMESSKKKIKEPHKLSRKYTVPKVEVQHHYTNTTDSSKGNSSEDLISLAYQAAEDGVEFTFVEDIDDTCANGKEIKHENSSELDNNVIYVQILDPAELNV